MQAYQICGFSAIDLEVLAALASAKARYDEVIWLKIREAVPGAVHWWIGGSLFIHVRVSKNRGTPKSSILTGFSIINHPLWGTPIFGNTHVYPMVEVKGWWFIYLTLSKTTNFQHEWDHRLMPESTDPVSFFSWGIPPFDDVPEAGWIAWE